MASTILIELAETTLQAQSFQALAAAFSDLVVENISVLHFTEIDNDDDQGAFFSYYGDANDVRVLDIRKHGNKEPDPGYTFLI